jgi:hypothetical protein
MNAHQQHTLTETKVDEVIVVRERRRDSNDKSYVFGVYDSLESAHYAYGEINHEYEVAFDTLLVFHVEPELASVSYPLHSISQERQ